MEITDLQTRWLGIIANCSAGSFRMILDGLRLLNHAWTAQRQSVLASKPKYASGATVHNSSSSMSGEMILAANTEPIPRVASIAIHDEVVRRIPGLGTGFS
jgi:hypothetical protein